MCPSCYMAEEEEFLKVKDYVYDNPSAKVEDIVEETGIEEKKILKWLQEGKLIPSKGTNITYPCKNCGKPITSGEYCRNCIDLIKGDIKKGLEKVKKEMSSSRDTFVVERRKDRGKN